ncbi:ribosome small subunit-dependent GTPase A [Leptotrichia sp. OH3620_COT-345]|nr:ribosome small subunit-dependent GTPase A [Leptotrichia sp. OH3620_COT-345]RRD39476.1 ribosome small subunit-dependent GTPase A [Leptotrichia sp. OH3620_COT-345]
MKGKVIRKIKGFYYVLDENCKNLNKENIYECKLRGSLKVKNDKLNCIIGDIVEFNENEKVITDIEDRKNFLHRPLLSNIDFIGILLSVISPNFDFTVFQKMLLNAYSQNIPVIVIISKIDLISDEKLTLFLNEIKRNFGNTVPVFPVSTEKNIGLDTLLSYIKGKSVTVSGPSGTGKSTLINTLIGENILETNEISSKTSRGRHTTTESRFFKIDINTYLIDTPGFSSLEFPKLKEKKELELLFPEFMNYIPKCKFRDCLHVNEPDCAVKKNVTKGNIPEMRYNFYLYSLNNLFSK